MVKNLLQSLPTTTAKLQALKVLIKTLKQLLKTRAKTMLKFQSTAIMLKLKPAKQQKLSLKMMA
jgi:hypothetical protein